MNIAVIVGTGTLCSPERLTLGELAGQWRAARDVRRLLIPIPPVGRTISALRSGALTSDTAPIGRVTFAEWLRSRDGRGRAAS